MQAHVHMIAKLDSCAFGSLDFNAFGDKKLEGEMHEIMIWGVAKIKSYFILKSEKKGAKDIPTFGCQ